MAFLVTMLLGIGTTTAFDLTCPNGISWKLRAKMFCPEKESYHCLHETYYDIYIEQCLNSTLSGEGRHYVVSGNLDSEECPFNTYSPSLEWSNGSANCRYKKSFCTEEGQKTAFHGSSKRDRSCRCDFTKQYDYLTRPMDPSNCFPILEDCSCYVRQCLRTDEFLTPDYECKRSNSQHVFSCPFVHDSRDENCNNKTEVHRDNFTKETSRLQEYYFDNVNRKTVGWVMVAMALITIILSVFFIIKQHKSTKCNKPKKKTKLQKPPAPKEIFHEELYTVTYFQPTKQQEEMKHAFDSDKHGVLLILEGIKGSGKTQAALHFCNEMKPKYSIIAKLMAGSNESLTNGLHDLVANKLFVQASYTDFNITCKALSKSLHNYLKYKRTSEYPCLLLLDDAKDHDDLLQMLEVLNTIKDLDIILTTNDAKLHIPCPHSKRIQFNGMEKKEYMALFGNDIRSSSDKDFEALVKIIGNLPLVLNSARSYMLGTSISVRQYLKLVQDEKNGVNFGALNKPEVVIDSQIIPLKCIKHKLNDKALWNVMMFLPLLMYNSVSTTVLEACYFHLERTMETRKKLKINDLITECLTFSICNIDVKSLSRIHLPTTKLNPHNENEERYLSFHEITMAALQNLDEQTKDENLKKEENFRRNFLLNMFCFEIDIDARADVTIQRNILFLDHANKLLTFMEPELEYKTSTKRTIEELFCISYLHCAIGSTLLFQKTNVESAHIHLVKARRIFLKIVGEESYFKKETCTFKQNPSAYVKSPSKEEINKVVENLSHIKLDPTFVEEFLLHNRRSENDIDAIKKETNIKLKDLNENYLRKDEYEMLKQRSCALSIEDLQTLLLFELFLRILLNNARALNELNYVETEKHLRSACRTELNTANEICTLIKERYHKYELFVCLENDRTGRMLMRWNQDKISTDELDQDIFLYEELLKRPFPFCYNFGVLKMSEKANDRHICTCYRIMLRVLISKHKNTQNELEKENIYKKGQDLFTLLISLLDKMEKESRHYTWIFLPLLNIQCAKFLLLSSNRKDIEQAKTIFQKAISLEESRRVFWTRFMHEGYHGLLLCLGKLGEKEEADKIFKGIKLKLEDKNRDRIISMLESLKYDNWD